MRTAASIARRTLVVAVGLGLAVLAASAARGAGPVVGWGDNSLGQATPPPSSSPNTFVFEMVQDHLESTQTVLTVGGDGHVYGAESGRHFPSPQDGALFRIDGAGVLSTIHTFPILTEGTVSSLVRGADDALYGVTDQALFFRLDQQGNLTSSVLSFPVPFGGFWSSLVLGSDGALYAALAPVHDGSEGGSYLFLGGVAKITNAGALTVLGGNFQLAAAIPSVVGSDGALYGSRDESIYGGLGGVVRWDVAGQHVVLHQYTLQEGAAAEGFTLGSDGLLYAVTPYGGTGSGAVFRFDTAGNATVLHEFAYADGANPTTPVTLGSDGALYGTAETGGEMSTGTVFRIDPSGTFSLLHSFNGMDGGLPNQKLVLAKNGSLYGVGDAGAIGACVFRIDPPGSVTSASVFPLFVYPKSPLVQGSDCALYGVAESLEGSSSDHVIYRVFEPGHLCQHIEFASLPDRRIGDESFTLSATASSGLAVSFTASGSCTVSGDQVTLTAAGLCTLTASQVGDANYQPAPDVSQSFLVGEADTDADGVADAVDNCPTIPNADQRDTNLDGYGNLCDADYDGDGFVTLSDFAILRSKYLTSIGDPAYNADVDMTGDGAISGSDFARFKRSFGRAVGQ